MNAVETPQTRCRAAIARCDITPPVGIYHRMWGAAKHERATGVHRPLFATILWLEPTSDDKSQTLAIVALDHCLFDGSDVARFRAAIATAVSITTDQVLICVSHTHAAGLMSPTRASLPGGELIGPYLDNLAGKLPDLAASAKAACQPAAIVYGTGRCTLAANRDFFDPDRQQFVCGLNPAGPADDTVIVGKIVGESGDSIGAIVNYACHPTTLAWQNTLISPDYIGAMRQTVEQHIDGPCLFLQGASGDLGPREGFVGDTAFADRNGRQLGFAALAAIEPLPSPGVRYVYEGPVISGATIGTWQYEHASADDLKRHTAWQVIHSTFELSYRHNLPTIAQAERELTSWQAREAQGIADGNSAHANDCHARVEQAQRQLWRLQSLPQPHFPLLFTLAMLGDAIWLFAAGEHYQALQTNLRARFPQRPILVSTITNGWQPGYLPPAEIYGRGVYQEQIAVVAPGTAEQLLAEITARIQSLLT
jgi:hypothetical protein